MAITVETGFSFAAAGASLALAIVAIWLSVKLFQLNALSAEDIKRASKEIDSGVKRLEALFDKMYSDTVDMVRDAYADIRRHAWPESGAVSGAIGPEAEVETRVETKLGALEREMDTRINSVIHQIDDVDGRVSSAMRDIVHSAITESRVAETEAREETVRDALLWRLRNRKRFRAHEIVDEMIERGFDGRTVVDEIERLRDEGLVQFEGEFLTATSQVSVSAEARRQGQRLNLALLSKYKDAPPERPVEAGEAQGR